MLYGKAFRLRVQGFIIPFANEKSMVFNGFSFSRLYDRLQIFQLSPLTPLQVPVVSLAVCKATMAVNPGMHPKFFAINPNQE